MKSKRKIINWTLLILWMIFIAFMSNQPAVISDSQSLGAIDYLKRLGIDITYVFGSSSNFVIRKMSHFLEYMILGILAYNVLILYFKNKRLIYITILICALYACSDEIHQFFIPGRECALRDIIIDTIGASVGTLINRYFTSKKACRNY